MNFISNKGNPQIRKQPPSVIVWCVSFYLGVLFLSISLHRRWGAYSMGINFQKHLLEFFRKNQKTIMDDENSFSQIYEPITIKVTPKTTGIFDILFRYKDQLYLAKCVKLAHISNLFPLDFEDSFIIRYNESVEHFQKNGHILNEQHIEHDFDYELSNPDNLTSISLGIMTSLPFLDELTAKILTSTTQKVERNDPCPCGSSLKYKKCCM